MNRLGLLICILTIGVHGTARANQVDGAVPPPPPAQAPAPAQTQTPAPAIVPTPPPVATAATPAPANYAPTPAPAPVGASAQWSTPAMGAGFVPSRVGVEEHDGFFLRLAIGFGGASWSEADTIEAGIGGDLEVSGVSTGLDIAIGAVITDNLAIHATIFGMGVSNPDVKVGGMALGTAENTALTGSAIGVGLTYYLMPANVYFSGSVGTGKGVFTFNSGTTDEVKIDTEWGYALDLIIGKEWWVSDQWGLGIAAQVVHMDVPDVDTRLVGTGFHLMFTATCN